ncbi:MAG: protein translocase subunit SecD [Clostridia bacterium]|nr:protein translocase subunit SecD [Clostridia bacterium]
MKSGKKRVGGKTGAIIALCVLLVITVVLGVIGVTGVSLPPKGLYKVLSWLPTTNSENWPQSLSLGLDLRGGMYVEYSGKAPEGSSANFEELVEGTMSIIRERLTDKGFTEANVQKLGTDGIRVEIPDVQDDTVLDLIGAAAKLEFYSPDGEVFMTGDMVKTATYYYSEGDHQIAFTLTDEGTKVFGDMTAASVGKTIAIYLDGEQLIAPTVQSAITNGSGVINGLGSAERATTIAAKIQSGALPLELTQQKVDKVSATLGQDAVSSSVRAAIIGILLIMVLMIIRYRLNGFIASWALTIYTILLFLLIALFHIQLTLPGLAGVVLGIGMAVDANVIIFERFNEEIRKGRSVKAAVRAGFKNAMSAILDANVTTLIAAIVLLFFGTGSIQGFAKTLLLGVVVSMFTAIMVTRFLMNRFVNAGATKTSLYTRVKAEEKEVEA